MIGSEVLLFPETGPRFMRALKSAALYSNRVHALTVRPFLKAELMGDFARRLDADCRPTDTPEMVNLHRRTAAYLYFLRDNFDDLLSLADEHILVLPEWGNIFTRWNAAALNRGGQADSAFQPITARFQGVHCGPAKETLIRFLDIWPPTIYDASGLILMSQCGWVPPSSIDSNRPLPDVQSYISWSSTLFGSKSEYALLPFYLYLLGIILYSEFLGAPMLSVSPAYIAAIRLASEIAGFSTNQSALTGSRGPAYAELGQAIVERYLPVVDDLPCAEILEIRRKSHPELEALRSGMAEMVAQLDFAVTPEIHRIQVQDLVAARIDPAVRDLQSKIYSARMDALKRIGQSWDSFAKMMVPFALSYAAGAPLNISAALSAIGPFLSGVIEYQSEKRKLLHASQWAILLKLKKLNTKVRS
ncbi:MAG: hypothetical protein C5B51_26390 [Terriglobia bacterium]|nr:MAG: hypothetical protein C5B51_26390 [Terriglobia bacterium]